MSQIVYCREILIYEMLLGNVCHMKVVCYLAPIDTLLLLLNRISKFNTLFLGKPVFIENYASNLDPAYH